MKNIENVEKSDILEEKITEKSQTEVESESEESNELETSEEDSVTFEDLGLDEYTLKAVEKKGFKTPSPIQVLAIPRLLNGDTNLIARARTGTGKTAAFGLPIIQSIREKSDFVQALILEPTRELAVQTCTEMQSFANHDLPRTTVLYGGASYATQIRDLKRGCEIVVGTPGRIKDHLERKTLDLSKIKYFILDEGDEMLDMGFIDDIREIFQQSNVDARILLFSATMPAPILKIAGDFMGEYDIIEEENVVDEALLIDQKFWYVKESEKIEALVRLIDMSPDFYGLVFTMTKNDADNVTRLLDMKGYEAAALHGDIMQNQREKVLERFRMKKTRILVATDVAARGIDISGLTHVVNYSLPFDTATYVHRIGRTGRAGTTGTAVTFVRPEERRKLGYFTKNVERATKNVVKEERIPSVAQVLEVKEKRIIAELKEKLGIVESPDKNDDSNAADSQIDVNANDISETQISEESKTSAESKTPVANLEIDTKFLDLAAELTKNRDATQILAQVLSLTYGEQLSSKHYGRISTKDFGPKGDQLRIFISLGKKDGYRAKEIAEYFSKMLHIPGRMVDDIDVAQQFSLVSLPVASAKKAIEMSKTNHKLPHMHIDAKEEGRCSRKRYSDDHHGDEARSKDRNNSRRRDSRPRENDSRGGRRQDREDGRKRKDFSEKSGKGKASQTSGKKPERKTGGAALYRKSSQKAERF